MQSVDDKATQKREISRGVAELTLTRTSPAEQLTRPECHVAFRGDRQAFQRVHLPEQRATRRGPRARRAPPAKSTPMPRARRRFFRAGGVRLGSASAARKACATPPRETQRDVRVQRVRRPQHRRRERHERGRSSSVTAPSPAIPPRASSAAPARRASPRRSPPWRASARLARPWSSTARPPGAWRASPEDRDARLAVGAASDASTRDSSGAGVGGVPTRAKPRARTTPGPRRAANAWKGSASGGDRPTVAPAGVDATRRDATGGVDSTAAVVGMSSDESSRDESSRDGPSFIRSVRSFEETPETREGRPARARRAPPSPPRASQAAPRAPARTRVRPRTPSPPRARQTGASPGRTRPPRRTCAATAATRESRRRATVFRLCRRRARRARRSARTRFRHLRRRSRRAVTRSRSAGTRRVGCRVSSRPRHHSCPPSGRSSRVLRSRQVSPQGYPRPRPGTRSARRASRRFPRRVPRR